MNPDIQQLYKEINDLKMRLDQFSRSSTVDRDVETALSERFSLQTVDRTNITALLGILQGTGSSTLTSIVPLTGTKVYYVSDSSGGAVTRKLTFTNGILTLET